ncbi:DUF2157 domain-containing protein [Diaphorobacter aerolatus]|uniref:DUF2157 domain-containing protein n=1 Tax=Diaphorobacter aerolatus TaxID=1288495 RepID=A0A7H0GH18_9BURK|nr:DUF2157 domain-containing protein [Diaphorobacter aerolatus]QNP47584.1 DUF2157 domain-containing protein [Diaphorobacter aerolatus]
MDSTLYQLAAQSPRDPQALAQLHRLATAPGEPRMLARNLHWGLLLVAALLLASGLIFWIAANWQEQTRMFKLMLIEGALLVSVLASIFWRRGRIAALLCATLAVGGLLAFVGQTYQTGADAWQLFATWAALALIWTLLARSDVLWLLWIGIAATAIVMWYGHLELWEMLFRGPRMRVQQIVYLLLWLTLAMVPWLVSLVPWTRHRDGMAWWSHRMALAFALAAWTTIAVIDLFTEERIGLAFPVSGLLIGAAMYLSYQGPLRDFASLCLCTLAANVWVLAMVARVAFEGSDSGGGLLLFTLAGLGCLGGTVSGLLAVQRKLRSQAAIKARAREVRHEFLHLKTFMVAARPGARSGARRCPGTVRG